MVIEETTSLLHWNYFLALESDLGRLSRFVEFKSNNFKTYSIETAHLLLAASSEVDVIARQLCQRLDSSTGASDIKEYRQVIRPAIPQIEKEIVVMPRHGLHLTPWQNWQNDSTPDWWRAYNNVKHERDTHFEKGNLQNVLNAMAGLFLLILHFYRSKDSLVPPPALFTPPRELASVSATFDGPMALHFNKGSR